MSKDRKSPKVRIALALGFACLASHNNFAAPDYCVIIYNSQLNREEKCDIIKVTFRKENIYGIIKAILRIQVLRIL